METKYRPITFIIVIALVLSYCFWSQLIALLMIKTGLPEIAILALMFLVILILVAIAAGSFIGYPFALFGAISESIGVWRKERAKNPRKPMPMRVKVAIVAVIIVTILAIWLALDGPSRLFTATGPASAQPTSNPTAMPVDIFRELIEIDHGHMSNPIEQVLLAVKDGCQPHQYVRIWVNGISTDYQCIPSGKG